MENRRTNLNSKTLDIVQISLMAAMIFIATYAINIPSPYKGVVHLGDSMIFVSAVLIGKKKGALASAIGMCMFDLLSPYAYWAPYTFVIKGAMGYIAASIALRKNYGGNNFWNNILAFSLAGVWMITAYYFSGVLVSHYYFSMAWQSAFILSAGDIISNIIQVVAGAAIAIPLIAALKKSIK